MTEPILFQEIHQQPQIMRGLLREEAANVESIAAALRGQFSYILIAARGTSDNAARYAQYLFQAHNRLSVGLATPSIFSVYNTPPKLEGALVIAISQSGQSPDIVSVVKEASRQGCPTVAITNRASSPLGKAARHSINLHAGEEKAVAATKTYTSSLGALAMLSTAFDPSEERRSALQRLPEWMETTLEAAMNKVQAMERYTYIDHCAMLARGFNYCTAFEVALKVKELTGVLAEPYSSADFLHGPIRTVFSSNRFPVLMVINRSTVYADLLEVAQKVKAMGAELLVISEDEAALAQAALGLPVAAGVPEWLTPLVNVLPGQVLAGRLAVEKGFDPDRPHGLSKVTETV